jgi:hypothetical protein
MMERLRERDGYVRELVRRGEVRRVLGCGFDGDGCIIALFP